MDYATPAREQPGVLNKIDHANIAVIYIILRAKATPSPLNHRASAGPPHRLDEQSRHRFGVVVCNAAEGYHYRSRSRLEEFRKAGIRYPVSIVNEEKTCDVVVLRPAKAPWPEVPANSVDCQLFRICVRMHRV